MNWTNEEGSRFRPAMMGSRVFASDMLLEDALAITDDAGISVAQALRDSGQAGPLTPSPRGWACWLEAHIEQGPVMEAGGADIGIVTGTMHARYFQLTVTGEPSHVGPTTMDRRRDSLAATAEIILAIEQHRAAGRAARPCLGELDRELSQCAGQRRERHTAALRCAARGCGAGGGDGASVARGDRRDCRAAGRAGGHRSRTRRSGRLCSTRGWGRCCATAAASRQLATRDMIAAAGHDSVLVAPLCPSAMLFVPSVGGITHNPREYSTPEQLARGAQVLLDAVVALAG